MGRTSKFFFPLPGRKSAQEKQNDKEREALKSSSGVSGISGMSGSTSGHQQSKAQRILGTGTGLNIDSPTRLDAPSWGRMSSRSSAMSISISESSRSEHSTNDTGSLSGSNAERWDQESGVFPKRQTQQLPGKASSTILGQQYGEGASATDSSVSRRLRNETSDSTLKSYYDRQKSPLAVSQQTSDSSARDLALRKGQPSILLRSPLLEMDGADPFDQEFAPKSSFSPDSVKKKKPTRLDLTKLFPRPRKATESLLSARSSVTNDTASQYSQSTNNTRRKLTKMSSKESLQSQKLSIRSTQSNDRQASTGNLNYLERQHTLNTPLRSAPMSQIPESRVPEPDLPIIKSYESRGGKPMTRPASTNPHLGQESPRHEQAPKSSRSHQSAPPENQGFSWKSVRSGMPPTSIGEVSSSASISSRNTRTSRHTSTSVFSTSNLKQDSVLSLSSDSEGDLSDSEPPLKSPALSQIDKASRVQNGNSNGGNSRNSVLRNGNANIPTSRVNSVRSNNSRQEPASKSQNSAPLKHSSSSSSRKPASASTPFRPLPQATLPNPRISGPWSPPDLTKPFVSTLHPQPEQPENRPHHARKSSLASSNAKRSNPQTPSTPSSHSPNSLADEFPDTPQRSSRLMAVTKQEEQLLEALRQKRMRMKEAIIQEHVKNSPPTPAERKRGGHSSRPSEASSVSTVRGPDGAVLNKGHILLYLDTPLSDNLMMGAEPSPDLSDFLSFGGSEEDADSTPRSSWQQAKAGRARPDSMVRKSERERVPMTPPMSAVRLSAVGEDSQHLRPEKEKRRNGNVNVRFVEEEKVSHHQGRGRRGEYVEDESDGIWGM